MEKHEDSSENFKLSEEVGQQELIKNAYKEFSDLVGWDVDWNILDVGCGDGWFQEFLQEGFDNILSISDNEQDVKQAQEKDLNAELIDIHNIDYENKFDVVWCRHSLEHFVSPYIALNKMNKALKKGGYLMLITPEANKNLITSETHLYVLNVIQLTNLLNKTEFDILHFNQYEFDKTDKVDINTWNEYRIIARKEG